ncbi:MAG: glycosyltransferase [Bdellovibrionales bacterium]|nr:glycosyltransferase [Bdellovibrionales bacterium]
MSENNLILYAPNVHTGGGLILLQALLSGWDSKKPLVAILDIRAQNELFVPSLAKITWVYPNIISRLRAEYYLSSVSSRGDLILCFHGLPPIFRSWGKVVIFLQNRLYLDAKLPLGYAFKTRLRLMAERCVSRLFRKRVSEYIVQTPSMKRSLLKWLEVNSTRKPPAIRILPFAENQIDAVSSRQPPRWDFVYVADGEAHKNHLNLIAAWRILAEEGLRPSLVLTLNNRDALLKSAVDEACRDDNLKIINLGEISRNEILSLYLTSRALVYPSRAESFGLPLLEAKNVGLPIIASELDYVRDICEPVQTFDHQSPVSIARAVKRFLKHAEPVLQIYSPEEFWTSLL